jgi:hypothetical protein
VERRLVVKVVLKLKLERKLKFRRVLAYSAWMGRNLERQSSNAQPWINTGMQQESVGYRRYGRTRTWGY